MKAIFERISKMSLIVKILIGLAAGTVLGLLLPQFTFISMLGTLFVGALKGIAPVLVFFIIVSSLSQGTQAHGGVIRTVILLYAFSTVVAAINAVFAIKLFPIQMVLTDTVSASVDTAPAGIMEVLSNMAGTIVQNPVQAIGSGNYLGILFWAVLIGIVFKKIAKPSTAEFLENTADCLSKVVGMIIQFAPLGILGLSYSNVIDGGLSSFATYGKLVAILIAVMLFQFFVVNAIIVFWCTRKNPYPLIFYCLRKSAVTAFFTRSSAANIPVNMEAASEMGLDKDTYSVTIPLGSAVNMDGAAITITIMTLATCNTLGIHVDLASAILLSLLASVSAAGASGIAGGSLLLIPLACSLFGIPDTISAQVIGVGFIIGVIQDSMETALNSSSDLLLTASAEFREWRREGKKIPF